jgi:two-component system response regulator RegX3
LLTARAREAVKVEGLDAGADDYVTKPFSLRELRARIRAQLRRTKPDVNVVHFGSCELDLDRAELRRDGVAVELTAQEFRILRLFIARPRRIISRQQLIDSAWGPGIAITDRVIDTHVFNLRRKIEVDPSAPRVLLSVRGLGYRFEP